ncbi:Phospholipase/Carboxylesterase [bacterium A37T11]|nr:Phospholipase/Carboxylesterase [bacterium A37T11]
MGQLTGIGFIAKEYIVKLDTLRYRILYPERYDPSIKYPILFVLHGSGERGTDNLAQLKHGSELFLRDSIRQKYPAIVIFPQCPLNSSWSNVDIKTNAYGKRDFFFKEGGKPTKPMALLTKLIKVWLADKSVDKNRVYIGGLSMGAMGTYEMLRRKPKIFAAAFAICGADNLNNVKKYRKVPLWIFHGEKDVVVLPENSIRIMERLKELGANPRFNLYPYADHKSWDYAFAEHDFLSWLFSHQLTR